MRSSLFVLALLSLGSVAHAAEAPDPPPLPPVRAVRTPDPIVVDGILDEPVWKSDNVVTTFVQADPAQGAAVSQRTEVRVAYDDDAIYIGARMYDTHPDSIVARLARRDTDSGSDYFAVGFDTFRDKRTGYYFVVSAAGTLLDGTYMNDDWSDDSWDGVWTGRAHRDSLGWTAELRIPLSQLRFRGGDRMVWGINYERLISRNHESDKLVYTPRTASGFVSRFPELVGLDGIRATHHYEVTPYTTSKEEVLAHSAGDPFNTNARYTPALGGDLRTSVGPKFTLNATINPDFGQVEIDPAVVNLSDVETYYNEKRPFFTEGLSVFRCGNNGASDYWNFNWAEPTFFYTRRIGRAPQGSVPDSAIFSHVPVATNILGAVKLTGSPTPQWNLGAVSALTQQETADFQLADSSRHKMTVEPLTYYGVMRGIRSFNHEHQGLGLMTMETARALDGTGLVDDLNRNALVAAMDGWTALDPKKTWVLSGYLTGSRIDATPARITSLEDDEVHYYQRPDRPDLRRNLDATSLTGYGGRMWLNRQTGPWMSNSAIGFLTPGYEPNDLGFDWRADMINSHVGVGYQWSKPNAWRKFIYVLGAVAEEWNFGGQQLLNEYFVKSYMEQANNWDWSLSVSWSSSTIDDRRTRGGPAVRAPSWWWSDMSWNGNSHSKFYPTLEVTPNLDAAGSYDVPVNASLTWKPSTNLSFSAGPTFEKVRDDAHYITQTSDPLAAATYGGRYVFARLAQTTVGAQMRMDCSFTPNLSLQLYVQPLVSSGRYTDYRELASPGTYDFLVYGRDNGSTITPAGPNTDVVVDPDGVGPAPAIDLGHPDFTYRTIRGDMVLRWEYVPGSAFYVVWTQDRTGTTGNGSFALSPSLSALARTPANNIFLVKLQYHFDL